MCHLLRYFLAGKSIFGSTLYFVINIWVKVLAFNKFLGQIVMKH